MSKSTVALTPQIMAEATRGLSLHIQKKDLEATLAEIKLSLTQAANGQTMSIPVAGLGTVTVTKPSTPVPSGEFSFQFNETTFKNLPAATRKSLIDRGVVTMVEKTKGGADAQVRYSINA